ncbi:protein DpdG [Nocardia sp. NPDC052278]|uniref:protein DpdG n=1 Tax=unclassified Nocardia TaxID=2637762 RepID=UPI0036C1A16D
MTALINTAAPQPRPLWATTRHLLSIRGKRQKIDVARALLSPPSLFEDGHDTEDVFGKVVKIGTELGVFRTEGEELVLTDVARSLDPGDPQGFFDLLRERTLGRTTSEELVGDPSLTSGKDLIRALCWFLTRPCDQPVDTHTFEKQQQDALPAGLRGVFTNQSRWNLFTYWAVALGFAATPLLQEGGPAALVPDCSTAVRRTIGATWKPGNVVPVRVVIDELIKALPVLPGGEFSRAMQLTSGSGDVSPVLSWALLDGHDRGALKLTVQSDASNTVQLVDPAGRGGVRGVALIEIGDTSL